VNQLPQEASRLARARARIGRHWHWGRTQGFGRLIEEGELDPRARLAAAYSKWSWRRRHGGAPGTAKAIYVVGVQRSGTNMLVRGLETSPEFEVHNENSRRAFERFLLKPDPAIRAIVDGSRHREVLFKPLCDSHRIDDILDSVTPGRGKAIWIYRHYTARTRSAVEKFGGVNRQVLADFARGAGADRWQVQRLSEATVEAIRAVDWEHATPETGAAMFWFARNSLYFDRGFAERSDIALVSYETMLADPSREMQRLCEFLDVDYDPSFVAHMEPRRPAVIDVAIADDVRAHCEALQARLDAHCGAPQPQP
jgi:hypothetical protein